MQNRSLQNGMFTPLDASKAGVEAFLDQCKKQQGNVTLPTLFLEGSQDKRCILSHLGDPASVFHNEVRNYSGFDPTASGNSSSSDSSSCTSTDFSYSASLAFSIINKHRVKNSMDRFGYGRCPWIAEPANVFIFTDSKAQGDKPFVLSKSPGTLGEYTTEAYRWDHRVFLFVVCGQQEPLVISPELAALCAATGGEVCICRNLKDAQAGVRNITAKILSSPLSIAVKFTTVGGETQDGSGGSGGGSKGLQCLTRLVVKGPGEWPIPEEGWVDAATEQLPLRHAVPVLNVAKPSNTSKELLQMARELKEHEDTYEISTGNVYRALGLGKDDVCNVFIPGSGRLRQDRMEDDSTSMTGNMSSTVEAFALLHPGKTSGTCQLTILPFNFPKCLHLIKEATEMLKSTSMPIANQQAWAGTWRTELSQYITQVPGYYYLPLQNIMKRCGLKSVCASLLNTLPEYKLHRRPYQRIQRAQTHACADIAAMEIVARDKWPKPAPPPFAVALASTIHQQQTLQVGSASMSMPKAVMDVHPTELLCVWEKMRQAIFGGDTGMTVNGINVSGIVGTGGHVFHGKVGSLASLAENDWFSLACGGASVSQETTGESASFELVLARQESPRDPMLVDVPLDEDQDSGILKRKLGTVNFGSRFSKKKSSSGSSSSPGASPFFDIDGISSSGVGVLSNKAADVVETAQDVVGVLFMDTPIPKRDSDDDETSGEASPSLAEVRSSNSSSSQQRTFELPPLGKPKKFSKQSTAMSTSIDVQSEKEKEKEREKEKEVEKEKEKEKDAAMAVASPVSVVTDKESPPASPLPEGVGWVKVFSKTHNRAYWFNEQTRESKW